MSIGAMPKSIQDTIGACPHLENALIQRVRFFRGMNVLEITLDAEETLPFEEYQCFAQALEEMTGSHVDLKISCHRNKGSRVELKKYLDHCQQTQPSLALVAGAVFTYDADSGKLTFLFAEEVDYQNALEAIGDIADYLKDCGFGELDVECVHTHPATSEVKNVVVNVVTPPPSAPKKEVAKNSYKRKKPDEYEQIELHEVHSPMNDVQFKGEVFGMDYVETKKNIMIQSFNIYDGTDAIMCKRFENSRTTREDLKQIKDGDMVHVCGRIEFDNFAKDLVFMPNTLEKIEKKDPKDESEQKRIEFHMHTNMSEMDGVCDIKEVVNYAYQIGHEGIVITDHCDVQSFVKAFNLAEGLKKKNPERPFKVGLGCEVNLTNDRLLIVRNPTDQMIDTAEFICFDIETTGLSCYFDHIIEFGAVKVKNGEVIDRKQLFVKPPIPIPPFIVNKTNITNDMVKNARPFAEVADEIREWIGDSILVAHNATFDYFWMNEEYRRLGQPPLTNTVVDTLDLSRALLRERRTYRLGNISRHYKVSYDEEVAHRADYDAEALYGIFVYLLRDARTKHGAMTLRDLQEKTQDDTCYVKVRRSHVCVIAKNHDGLRDLYKLVTESNTSTLAVMGKASGKEGTDVAAEPRVLRSSLQKHRKNLLVGSACLNGEVFEMACNGDDERLMNTMMFYDYIELQPLGNYSIMLATGSLPSLDRLKLVQKRIIDMAAKLGKPVIADSDAHYCKKEEKIFRDVYIMNQGVGGAIHPLYIRDDNLRMRTPTPDQHLRFTEEMRKEFSWLDDPECIEEIVVKNPRKLFEQIETVRPVPKGTFPPKVEGSDDKLRNICHATAKRMYEFEGKIPDIVTERLDFELNNIITNGFGVHYYIAHLLVKKSNDDGYVVGSRGSVGSSFTATMSGITEVNPLKPHYLCPKCRYSEWMEDPEIKSGFDLPDKACPHCGTIMKGNGHNIPFQTFLGFNADKTPDIDLNFSNEYQARAHAFIKEVFGDQHAFRAGTIGTVAEKTAFGYVLGYCEKSGIEDMRKPMKDYLASHCQNVKRTTGQHPGGIIIIPDEFIAEDFTPVQYPANDPSSEWKTTHYDFHDIHDNVLKFDILGHVDPTAMRLLQKIATVKPLDIPMNDPETLSLFYKDDALKADPNVYKKETGALGLPEFGTKTTRNVLVDTRPHLFSDLVIISGLSHGTDVWAGNAQELVKQGHPLSEVIGCRDDIMTYLLDKGLESLTAFKIMEDVRKGRGLTEAYENDMKAHNVPDWYIGSCKKIKYMFPKAHAVAYVMMAVRIAWYKVHEPHNFYIQFLSLRCDAYEIETMSRGLETVRSRMEGIQARLNDRNTQDPVSNKEKSLYDTLEVCEELYARGYRIAMVDLYKSLARNFTVLPEDTRTIIPPFTVIDGLGENVAKSIEEARKDGEFISKEDIVKRTLVSTSILKKLEVLGCLDGMQESNQMSLF